MTQEKDPVHIYEIQFKNDPSPLWAIAIELRRIANSLAGRDEEMDGNFYDQMERIKDSVSEGLDEINGSLGSIDHELESIKNHLPE